MNEIAQTSRKKPHSQLCNNDNNKNLNVYHYHYHSPPILY